MRSLSLFGVPAALGLAILSTQASAVTVFGAKLNHNLQVPSLCNPNNKGDLCSWVLTLAQANAGHETAPHDGTLTQIRIEACGKGSFVLQIAQANPSTHQASVVRTGPLINYVGSLHNCNGTANFFIEKFPVNIPIKAGQYLGVVASRVNFVTQSGDSNDVFDPPLADGQPARTANNTGHGGGLLMLQAVMTP